MEATFSDSTQKKWYSNKILNTFLLFIILAIASFIVVSAFWSTNSIVGHDIEYHSSIIRSLNCAWQNGTFGQKIYGLICMDFGYGNGIFYSTIPASICVIFMNVLHLSAQQSIVLEFWLLIFLSAIVMYYFARDIFNNNVLALIASLIYALSPYYIVDMYVRFAFSEVFLMLALPMITYGIYALIEKENYKVFMLLFSCGYILSILCHFTLSIYFTALVLVYIIIRWKKFLSNYKYIPFLISCFIVVLVCASFYIPMLVNLEVVDTSSQLAFGGGYLYSTIITSYYNSTLCISAIYIVAIYLLFYIVYHFNKQRKQSDKLLFKISTIVVWITTPLFPWFIIWGKLSMIQFAWRTYAFAMIFCALMVAYVVKNTPKKAYKYIAVIGVALFSFAQLNIGYNNIHDRNVPLDNYVSNVTFVATDGGTGAGHTDYHTKNANNDYLYKRNEGLIYDGKSDIYELANYQSINQLSYIVSSSHENYKTIFNIPYEDCTDIKITQIDKWDGLTTNILVAEYTEVDGENLLTITHKTPSLSMVTIEYVEGSAFDNYLKQTAFEVLTLEGNATTSNLNKEKVTDYTFEVTTTEKSVIELPTMAYKGYVVTLTKADGTCKILNATLGRNGLLEVEVSESGILHVSFEANYSRIANIISLIGVVLLALVLMCVFIVPRKYYKKLADKITALFKKYPNLGEIIRFVIVGGIATVFDMLTMGVTMYFMQKSIYSSFINVFINAPTPSTLATILGTTFGFIFGLFVNYILSIAFVFNEKGKGKSAKGFIIFTVLSAIGLGINVLGTYIGFDLMHINQWVVKIIMILIVLVYNYISKKLILFKKDKKQ